MTNQLSTIGNIQQDTRGRIRTARTGQQYPTLRNRRAWYADPPPADPPADPPAPPAKDAKFTQADMDAVQGRTRKEAADSARKALLKELGIENVDDPDAIKSVKGKLTIAQQAEADKLAAEEATKTELQKLQERLSATEKERDAEKQRVIEVENKRRGNLVDTKLTALAEKSGAFIGGDVVEFMRNPKNSYADDVAKLLSDDDKFDDKKAQEMIDAFKKTRPTWFQGAKGAGSPSLSGGQTPGMDDKAARDANWKQARRGG